MPRWAITVRTIHVASRVSFERAAYNKAIALEEVRMSKLPVLFLSIVIVPFSTSTLAQSPPPSDPQALTFAAQSIAAMTGRTNISDVTITGNVTWNGIAGTAALKALGTGESRMDLSLSSGTRTEIRDVQTGMPLGKWINTDGTSGHFASHNCSTDAVWFFPVLGSLAAGQNVVLSYIGQESRDGASVQHLQSYVYQGPPPTPQQLSTMDFYLDANTLLPVAITYNEHPDNSLTTNLLVEVDFANYQNIGGVNVPTHIQRFQQGALMVDFTVSGAAFNTGLQISNFTIN
jgi:hypothetical protein